VRELVVAGNSEFNRNTKSLNSHDRDGANSGTDR